MQVADGVTGCMYMTEVRTCMEGSVRMCVSCGRNSGHPTRPDCSY